MTGHAPPSPRPGLKITANLQLTRPLGAGGMASVWVAQHLGLHTEVVVKFMAEHLAADPNAIARFTREAAAASQVKSPHVVQMIDHGTTFDGRLFIAMELLDGVDLAAVLGQRGKLSPSEVATIITHVARALTKAHERQLIHRDIKPENIFLVDAGGGELFAKVLDFGVAKSSLTSPERGTTTGTMVGTPYYMAPEQVMGDRTIDSRADLWALGVVAFEALTGSLPFCGETVGAVSIAICHEQLPLPSLRNPALPAAVDGWFLRACSRDRTQRFASAMDMAEALRTALAAPGSLALATVGMPDVEATGRRQARPTTGAGVASAPAAAVSPSERKWLAPTIALAVVVGGATAGFIAFQVSRSEPATEAEPEAPKKKRLKAASVTEHQPPGELTAGDPEPSVGVPGVPSKPVPSVSASTSATVATTAPVNVPSPKKVPTATVAASAAPAPSPTATATAQPTNTPKKKNVVLE